MSAGYPYRAVLPPLPNLDLNFGPNVSVSRTTSISSMPSLVSHAPFVLSNGFFPTMPIFHFPSAIPPVRPVEQVVAAPVAVLPQAPLPSRAPGTSGFSLFPENFRFSVTPVHAGPTAAESPRATVRAPEPGSVGYVRWALEGDLQIARLRELRKSSGLGRVSVEVGLRRLRETAKKEEVEKVEEDGGVWGDKKTTRIVSEYHDPESLRKAMSEMIHPMPSLRVVEEVFDFFDFDGNRRIDALELIGGCALLCAGSEEEKLSAAFNVFDSDGDGYITMDEMFKFLSSVFRVVLSPAVVAAMRTLSVNVESADDLAAATALECFKTADLNDDGKLNIHEFKRWFNAPSRFPLFN